jgi:hypothetical protein
MRLITDKSSDIIQWTKDRYEIYHGYGKSDSSPWVEVWDVDISKGQYHITYAEFGKKHIASGYLTEEQFSDLFEKPVTFGTLPDLIKIRGLFQ